MAKIKLPTKSPHIDMTPMVDLFSLLLTFFMLTTSFRPQEAAVIDTPSSISEKQAPDKNIMTVSISKVGKIYLNIDNGSDTSKKVRTKLLEKMSEQYSETLTPKQIDRFSKLNSVGMPMKHLKAWLTAEDQTGREAIEKKLQEAGQDGIPIDSANNEFSDWVLFARTVNPDVQVAIKADMETDYILVKKVLDILQDKQVNKFNLTTNLEKVEVKLEDIQ